MHPPRLTKYDMSFHVFHLFDEDYNTSTDAVDHKLLIPTPSHRRIPSKPVPLYVFSEEENVIDIPGRSKALQQQ